MEKQLHREQKEEELKAFKAAYEGARRSTKDELRALKAKQESMKRTLEEHKKSHLHKISELPSEN